jgi:hypothetical protein
MRFSSLLCQNRNNRYYLFIVILERFGQTMRAGCTPPSLSNRRTHVMKALFALTALALLGLCPFGNDATAAPLCPKTSSTNTDCGFILTVNPNGTVTGALVAGANPYDGSDDALVGIINNSATAFQSITLTGSGNGGGIFGFDGDGICGYVTCGYSHPTGYEGPLNTFTSINSAGTTGTVLFAGAGLVAGASTYFSLEGSPASISAGGGVGVPTGVPEPASLALLGVGMLGMMARRGRPARG